MSETVIYVDRVTDTVSRQLYTTTTMLRRFFVVGVVLALIYTSSSPSVGVMGYSDGAPKSACVKLEPNHNVPSQDPTVATNPFRLELVGDKTEFEPGESVRLRIMDVTATATEEEDNKGFRGFILQGRDETGQPRGQFVLAESGDDGQQQPVLATRRIARTLNCGSDSDTVTHRTSALKSGVEFTWKAPELSLESSTSTLTVRFKGAVARNMQTYWTDWNVTLSVKDTKSRLVEPLNHIEVLADEL